MALILSDDERMLVDTARGLLERSAPIAAFRALRDSDAPLRYEPELLAMLAENGLIAPNIREESGGVGMGLAATGMIAEQAGHGLAAAPMLSAAMAAELIEALGDEAQRASLLPAILSGGIVVAVAIEEASRHDPRRIETQATREGEAFRLSGAKTAVIDGFGAGHLLVSAQLDGAVRMFLVDPGSQGCLVERIDSIDSRNLAKLTLNGAPAAALGGENAPAAIGRAIDAGRALLAAELLGIADRAFTMTVDYLKEREQFGRKIGSFQGLQHRAARLYARLDLARGVVLKALRALDAQDEDASFLASLSKGVMTALARDVLVEAVQMHGGIGVTDEFDIGLFYKRARIAGELLGDDRYHGERLAVERWGL